MKKYKCQKFSSLNTNTLLKSINDFIEQLKEPKELVSITITHNSDNHLFIAFIAYLEDSDKQKIRGDFCEKNTKRSV